MYFIRISYPFQRDIVYIYRSPSIHNDELFTTLRGPSGDFAKIQSNWPISIKLFTYGVKNEFEDTFINEKNSKLLIYKKLQAFFLFLENFDFTHRLLFSVNLNEI